MPKFKCVILRALKQSTIAKKSCDELIDRIDCYSQNSILPYTELFPETNNPISHAFTDTIDMIGKRECPMITTKKLKQNLKNEFPQHRFKINRTNISIPKTFKKEELSHLEKNMDKLSGLNYQLRYNERLKRNYLSPTSYKERHKNEK